MSTTPRSGSLTRSSVKSSPRKAPQTPDRTLGNQSMVVEPPSKMEQGTQTPEDVTVRVHSQMPQDSPSRKAPTKKAEPNHIHHAANHRRDPQPRARTPETQKRRSDRSAMTSPGTLAPFDWEDFNERYERALQEADADERQMLEEFDRLVKYFNVWAAASSNHDNERAAKRLQTRQRYVQIHEQSLSQKKKHLAEVVAAFQSALALLSTS